MGSRFGNTQGQVSIGGVVNVYTALAAVGALILLLGVLFMIFHNLEYSKGYDRGGEGGIFTILE